MVQDAALEILDMVDETEKESRRIDTVRGLLASTPMERVKDFFPEYFQPEVALDPIAEAYNEAGEFDIDKVDVTKVEWQVPSSEEDADLSAWIEEQERKTGGVTTFTGDEWV